MLVGQPSYAVSSPSSLPVFNVASLSVVHPTLICTSTVLQLGKIGGRLRRQAICLLAVVLDPAGEDAPALTKLLEQLPQVWQSHWTPTML